MLMAAESEAMGTEQSAAVRLEPMAEVFPTILCQNVLVRVSGQNN